MKETDAIRFRYSVAYTLSFIGLLWLIKTVEWALSIDFGVYGIHPRTLEGTFGIITGPLIHGDFMHLLSNSFPLILLGVGIFYFYGSIAVPVFLWIYFMTGISVWFFARDAYHIGASGIVYGLVAFLFFSGFFRRDIRSIAIALIVFFLYGGMFYGILPTDPRISWESHLLGSFTGICCAFYFKNAPLAIATPQPFDDEDDDLDEDDLTKDIAPSDIWSNSADTPDITFKYTYVGKMRREAEVKSDRKP